MNINDTLPPAHESYLTSEIFAESDIVPPRIAGFWRRFWAFTIDGIVLAILGCVIGVLASDQLIVMGPWASLIGCSIAMVYFGFFHSNQGKGKTLGKRCLGIKVVNCQGELLSLNSALLRYVPLGIYMHLNAGIFATGASPSTLAAILVTLISLIGLYDTYLIIFNRRTRQSFHDVLCTTYVVHDDSQSSLEGTQPIWLGHKVILGTLTALTLFLPLLFGSFITNFAGEDFMDEATELLTQLYEEHEVHQADFMYNENWMNGVTTTSYSSTVHLKSPDSIYADESTDIANLILNEISGVEEVDYISITLIKGYDLGIWNATFSYSKSYPPEQWRKMIDAKARRDENE